MNYEQAYDELLARHKRLSESNDELGKQSLKLRAEIRSLHRKLRDSNRGAERLHLMNAQLRIELVDYKLKQPEIITTT